MKKIQQKFFSRHRTPLAELPLLTKIQLDSFKVLLDRGLGDVLKEFSPIRDYSEKKFELEILKYDLGEPKYDEHYAKANKLTYEAPLRLYVRLNNKTFHTTKEQEIFLADFPLMTSHGTFIINGVERVIVPQLARSFGIFFTAQEVKGRKLFGAKIIPARGVWVEFESDPDGAVFVRIDKKRKFPATSLLRIIGGERSNDDIIKAFKGDEFALESLKKTFDKDPAKNINDSYIEIYGRLRDGDLATVENAKEFIASIFSKEKYDLSDVGRFKFNKRFDGGMDKDNLARRTIDFGDIAKIFIHIAKLNNTPSAEPDDIDHLGSRRVRSVGEMLVQKVRVGMSQMKRNIQDKMSTIDASTSLPVSLMSPRPLQARIKEFFTTNQLSQFMSQENVLYEVEHLRTLSALGPGGLSRERAGFEVRDVHPSHYGRVCPIHTPEGPNIGLILRLAAYARINDFGMIEAPYVKVENGRITKKIEHLDAIEEEKYNIAHAGLNFDSESGKILDEKVEARIAGYPGMVDRNDVHYVDVATNEAFSVATSLIPFLEHDEANRALMGSNMQKQSTPCITPEAPIVATGMEARAAFDSGRIVIAPEDGEITYVDAGNITFKNKKGEKKEFNLVNFSRTNSFTAFHQRPVVDMGQTVKKGDVLADTSSSVAGQLALGQNVRAAFISWGGANYEDAIILSERLVKNSKFTSVHIEEFSINVRDTKLGPEVTTHDIPNVSEAKLKDLDEEGIVRIGAEVGPGDILVGKITPKGEVELTPEERLLRSIFGEKARDVKDSSLRMEHGKRGRVIGVKVFSRERGDSLESGIIKSIHIEVAQLRNVSVGDKLAGRHGNKGVISMVLPEEDMPFTEDGEPVDIILTPLGVPSRMNLGQILELHLGLAAHTLGYQAVVPPFAGATVEEIQEELKKAGFNKDGKMKLFDGRTGEPFEQEIAVGYMYMLKLHHMVEDKIHMRSIGPYSLITQQPLGGKAQQGGQRFGEMEVWALEGYGAAHTLREMLTIKSDDIIGRSATFDSIVKGEGIKQPNIPASFSVLLKTLKGLALDVTLNRDGVPMPDK
ncbi:DNA-directed RNA polymerase subunit beta [bacterium]|nr:DNA-directed RNA polymerase subunit beta [bacterium]MCI0566446.1 DNA-directed RNA polymerase subunit beta [bacterium]MCI0679948.1 DNA-directed RNA polymerase subunit beta [bacterium]